MKSKSNIDALELKRKLQARVRRKHKRLGEPEAIRQFQHWLNTSDDSLAVFWRSTQSADQANGRGSKPSVARRKRAS
jgi:hypothetical protein